MAIVNVILIEDSALMRLVVSDMLKSDADINLIATANNGKEGVEKVLELKPHVVITDLVMPDYDGIYAIKEIRKNSRVPIMVLSAANSNSTMVFDAMNAGATDFMEKPKGGISTVRNVDYELLSTVKQLANLKLGKSIVGSKSITNQHVFAKRLPYNAIVIGSSTGGPTAVEEVLKKLPVNLPIPIIIAQHMPKNFIAPFAKRLNTITPLNVIVAEMGTRVRAGNVYIAGGETNTEVEKTGAIITFKANNAHYKDFNNPSVTCLFDSAAEVYGSKCISIMLTGMGKDGATGMKKIFDKGGFCIAQEKSTCVVFGMPGSAVAAGAVTQQIKLRDIGVFVVGCLSD
jgi:two-component system chemotaxis response regulator CheB